MNTNKNFISETLIIVACFIIFLGMSSISFTVSATEDMMAAIYNLTTNEIKETTAEKNDKNIQKANDVKIENTIVFSSDKFDVLEVDILSGDYRGETETKKKFTLWDLDNEAKSIIEKIIK